MFTFIRTAKRFSSFGEIDQISFDSIAFAFNFELKPGHFVPVIGIFDVAWNVDGLGFLHRILI